MRPDAHRSNQIENLMFCCIALSLLSSSSLLNNKIYVFSLTWDMNQVRKAYVYMDKSVDVRQDRLLSKFNDRVTDFCFWW